MTTRQIVETTRAPAAIGTYSQAVKAGGLLFISGQIPFVPDTMEKVDGDINAQIAQVFDNLKAIVEEAGVTFDHVVKINIYLTNLAHFPQVNAVMATYFKKPYPARAAVEVSALPRGVEVEMEAIVTLS